METNQIDQKNEMLWAAAQKRTKFKTSLMSYLMVNTFLIGVWVLGDRDHFWPMWVILGWGLGLVIKYLKVYHFGEIFSAEKEYEKLSQRNSK